MIFRAVLLAISYGFAVNAAPDASTPRAAVTSLWRAVLDEDAHALHQALFTANDVERELASAMADLLVAGERLKRAARERYGDAGDAIGRRMIDADDAAALERAVVVEKGDFATVTIEGAQRPLTFRRTDQGWKLIVTGPEGGRPQATAEQTALIAASARAVNEAAEEISNGRHASVQAASKAIEAKLHAVMLKAHSKGAATQPAAATRPVEP